MTETKIKKPPEEESEALGFEIGKPIPLHERWKSDDRDDGKPIFELVKKAPSAQKKSTNDQKRKFAADFKRMVGRKKR